MLLAVPEQVLLTCDIRYEIIYEDSAQPGRPNRDGVSASQRLLHDSLMATAAEWQRGMYSIAVEVGTVLPVGFVSCNERLGLRTWLPSMFTDF